MCELTIRGIQDEAVWTILVGKLWLFSCLFSLSATWLLQHVTDILIGYERDEFEQVGVISLAHPTKLLDEIKAVIWGTNCFTYSTDQKFTKFVEFQKEAIIFCLFKMALFSVGCLITRIIFFFIDCSCVRRGWPSWSSFWLLVDGFDPIPVDAVVSQTADVIDFSFSVLSRGLAESSTKCSPQLLHMKSYTTPVFSSFLSKELRAANKLL